jgi:glycosyltransferase involved in cell wall biosynthesis
MRKIRIVYIVTGLTAGGAETMLSCVVGGLDRGRFDPTVISLIDGRMRTVIEKLGVPVRTAGLQQGQLTLAGLLQLIRLTRQAQPDLIHGWMYHGNLAAQFVSLFAGRPPVCWGIRNSFHTFAVEKPLTRLVIRASALLSRLPAKIVYVSHASRPAHERIGFCGERACVISNGFDTSHFVPSEEARKSLRAELGVGPETPLVGMLARYHPQKDHGNFCRAAAIALQKHPDLHFVLAGEGIDRGNVQLAKFLESPLLRQRVHLLGERKDVARVTAALDIATLSSSFGEGFSVAVGEAMSCAAPCVVTDVGDCAFTVGNTGVVVPPRDAGALAHGWNKLLSIGPEGRRALGRAARRRIQKNFSLAAIIRKYEDLYTSLFPLAVEENGSAASALPSSARLLTPGS